MEAPCSHRLYSFLVLNVGSTEDGAEDSPQATHQAATRLSLRRDSRCRRLHHGVGQTTWAVLDAALDHGRDIRVGFEDTLHLPDGRLARDNAELVAAAVEMVRRHGRSPVSPPGGRA